MRTPFLSLALISLLLALALLTCCSGRQLVPSNLSPGKASLEMVQHLKEGLNGLMGELDRLRGVAARLGDLPPDVDPSRFDMEILRKAFLAAWKAPVDPSRAVEPPSGDQQEQEEEPKGDSEKKEPKEARELPLPRLAPITREEVAALGYATGFGEGVAYYYRERVEEIRELRDQLTYLLPGRSRLLRMDSHQALEEASRLVARSERALRGAEDTGVGLDRAMEDHKLARQGAKEIEALHERIQTELDELPKGLEEVSQTVEKAIKAMGSQGEEKGQAK